jgi:hypothetical protein
MSETGSTILPVPETSLETLTNTFSKQGSECLQPALEVRGVAIYNQIVMRFKKGGEPK